VTTGVVLCLSAGFAAGYLFRNSVSAQETDWPILGQAYEILKNHGLKEMPPESVLEYGAIRGLLQAYNEPYTQFIEPPQHELEGNSLHGSFGGIGVRLGHDPQGFWVLYPQPDSPASRAGIQEGDRLLKVEDLLVDPETSQDTIEAALRGPVRQKVRLTTARKPDFSPVERSIERAEIPLPSVTWHLDPGEPRLGIIEVNLIAASTPEEIQKAVKEMQSRGASAFILDLRENFGGLLKAGIDTARLFLNDGVVIQQQYRGKPTETFRVEKPGPLAEIPMVIVVNDHTASAAEIVAGSLQAQGRAMVIGTPTYGKDTVQLIFDLEDGSSLHVTAARWWVPGLEPPLAEHGLQPDILVEEEPSSPGMAERAAVKSLFGTK
jgi:carboxyl-terminal processing protease